jgi:hypothetical protein
MARQGAATLALTSPDAHSLAGFGGSNAAVPHIEKPRHLCVIPNQAGIKHRRQTLTYTVLKTGNKQ